MPHEPAAAREWRTHLAAGAERSTRLTPDAEVPGLWWPPGTPRTALIATHRREQRAPLAR